MKAGTGAAEINTSGAGGRTPSQGAPEPRRAFAEHYELPSQYGATAVTLIARDPYWIHAYWEISPSSIETLRGEIGDGLDRSGRVLRMYDVTNIDFNGSNANRSFDIDVGPHVNNWYINLWNDNVSYCADIGVRAPDGRFFALARSNFVTTPRAHSTGRADMIWMDAKDGAAQPPYIIPESREIPPQQRAPAKSPPQLETARPRRKVYLTERDIRSYYSKMFPLLKRVISARRRGRGNIAQALAGRGVAGGSVYLKDGVLLQDLLVRGLSRREFIKRYLLGSSAELVLKGGASEELVKGGASEREAKKRKFFFEIGTELIVYGRTEPDAEVWFGDKRVKLREDGTFTLRFALPDGKIPLDFTAISSDKVEKRAITTAAERHKTRYNPY